MVARSVTFVPALHCCVGARPTGAEVDGCFFLFGQEGQPVNTSAPFLYAAQDREGEAARQFKPGGGFVPGHWNAEQGCGASHFFFSAAS